MRNIAAHQAMHVRQQAAAIAQRNNRHMLMQQNLRLARSAFATVVRELTEAQPTADELELLIEVVQEAEEQNLAPEEIETRLEGTRLWRLLQTLAKNDLRILAYLTLLLMIYQTILMREPAEQPPPQITVNVTVDADEVAEKVAKRLEEDGVCLVPDSGSTPR